MIRKQLYLDDDLNDGLRLLAARTGHPEAEHVRRALRLYLEAEISSTGGADDPLLALVGMVEDAEGPTDAAARHDDYLYSGR